jgi:tripartite-type tricarboxylate transporter receptor subunit TctC
MNAINRRGVLAGIGGVLSVPAIAQEAYPSRSVRIIVPFAAGGGADAVARALAQKLSGRMGQQFVVDNRPGGAGNIGTEGATRAAPDGYALLLTGPSHVTNAHLFRQLPFEPLRGFAPISLLTSAPYVLVANPMLNARDFRELLALARSSRQPLSYGSAGNGTAGHLAMEMIKAEAGVDLVHVPYRGSPPLLTDLIAGFDVTVWQGALFPAGVEPAIINRLAAEMALAMQASDMRSRLTALGVEPIGSFPTEFSEFLAQEHQRWGDVIRRSGAQVD